MHARAGTRVYVHPMAGTLPSYALVPHARASSSPSSCDFCGPAATRVHCILPLPNAGFVMARGACGLCWWWWRRGAA
ncbi:hypothetical protein ABL78_8459 [Leptomonas seymouri]|uniref:Uncharacterized protein n=1 Tax=Leptomonas seymouri TaxID=5684 RepID=A0A0N1HZ53_LEPSE|nr:hypothetical protein ABL78_8459 [Leptomonas seymouri]|eukprot:KPI82531.1 hypothetical protein ABL78_8459 [Leptomonas seymouri]